MKHNWEYKRLGEICDFLGGGTPSKSNSSFYTGSIPWATVRDMTSFELNSTEFKITEEAVKNSSTQILPKGMIIICTHVGLGKICILQQDTAINQDLKGIKFKNINVDKHFFVHWYRSVANFIIDNGKGATVKGVTLDFMRNLKMPVPPMEVQEQIVAELDKLNEMISTRKEQLKELDNLAQSLFYDTFGDPNTNPKGWEVKTFGTLCKLSAGGDKPADTEQAYSENKCIPIYSNGTINEGLYGYTSKAKINEPSLTISGRGTIGVPYIRKIPFVPIIRLIVATPYSNIDLFFLYHLIKILKLGGNGASIPQLTVPMIKDRLLVVPPLSLQQQFATQVKAIEKQKEIVESSIAELQTLLDSRMDYWFN